MDFVQIPTRPKPGDIWFFIELRLVTEAEFPSLYGLVKQLNFQPQFATRQVGAETDVCLLLYHENRSKLAAPPLNYVFLQEQESIANFLRFPEAMHFLCGLHQQPAIAA